MNCVGIFGAYLLFWILTDPFHENHASSGERDEGVLSERFIGWWFL